MSPEADASGDLVPVFLTNGTPTSDGPGPGVKHLPPDEAGRLVRARLAVYGDRAPRAYHGTDEQAPAIMMPRNGSPA